MNNSWANWRRWLITLEATLSFFKSVAKISNWLTKLEHIGFLVLNDVSLHSSRCANSKMLSRSSSSSNTNRLLNKKSRKNRKLKRRETVIEDFCEGKTLKRESKIQQYLRAALRQLQDGWLTMNRVIMAVIVKQLDERELEMVMMKLIIRFLSSRALKRKMMQLLWKILKSKSMWMVGMLNERIRKRTKSRVKTIDRPRDRGLLKARAADRLCFSIEVGQGWHPASASIMLRLYEAIYTVSPWIEACINTITICNQMYLTTVE